jgi:predicted small metal-binding protein
MDRKFVDCREYPSEKKCTVAISADTEDEVIEAAVQHAVKTHGHTDSPEFRQKLRGMIKTGVRV